MDHPIVRQTIEDCLTEAMDVDGFLEVLRGLKDGSIERRAVDTVEPSAFARGILSSQPYTFLDDAPLEERRTQAVISRRVLDARSADEIGTLDPEAIARVREEAWPQPDERRGSARGAPLDGLRHRRGGPPVAGVAGRARRRGPRRARGRPLVRGGGAARSEDGAPRAAWRLSGRSSPRRPTTPCSASSRPRASCCAPASRGARPGATGGSSRASTATRSTACARRSSPSRPRSSCASSRAGSTPTPSIASTARAASRRSSRSSPASRSRRPRGKAASSRRACAGTSASGWTSSRSRARSRGGGSGARAPGPIRRDADLPRRARGPRRVGGARRAAVPAREPSGTSAEVHEALAPRRDVPPGARARDAAPADVRRGGPGRADRARARHVRLVRRAPLADRARRRGAGPPSALDAGAGASCRAKRRRPPSAEFVARRAPRRTGVVFRKTLAREKQPVPWRDVARVAAARSRRAARSAAAASWPASTASSTRCPKPSTLLRAVRKR